LCKISQACKKVVGSGLVGPDAMVSSESPTTSDRIKVSAAAGDIQRVNPPPLTVSMCFRSVLISSILAPQTNSKRISACISCKVIPGAGAENKADPPPEIKQITRSDFCKLLNKARICCVPAMLFASEYGWPASSILMFGCV